MQWTPEGGFSSSARTWLPMGPESDTRNVESELADPGSVLNLYRRLLAVRKSSEALMVGEYRELAADHDDILMFERRAAGERVVVVVNFCPSSVNVAVTGEVLVSTDMRDGFAEETWTLEPHGAVIIRG
jgi:glycosidase